MSAPVTGELVSKYQQEDLKYLLESDDLFNDINIITEDDGNVAQEVLRSLGVFQSKDGKRGACVVIRQPVGSDERPGVSFGPLQLDWEFLVLELRETNKREDIGTQKKAWTIARRIARIMKPYRAGGLTMNFTPKSPCIIPTRAEAQGAPLVAYNVRYTGPEGDPTIYSQVATPTIACSSLDTTSAFPEADAGDTVTLACGTIGADIYYTNDYSHPCPQNPNASLYSAPFVMDAGTLRVRAHKSGNIGSIVVAALFS